MHILNRIMPCLWGLNFLKTHTLHILQLLFISIGKKCFHVVILLSVSVNVQFVTYMHSTLDFGNRSLELYYAGIKTMRLGLGVST